MILRDLEILGNTLSARFKDTFDASDRILPKKFRDNVTRIGSFPLKYNNYSVVFCGDGRRSRDSYIPNQQFYIALHYAEYVDELRNYRQRTIEILEKAGIVNSVKDKIADNALTEFFTNEREHGKEHIESGDDKFVKILEEQGIIGEEKELLTKFVTNYSWWHGAKTIDRNDFYNSAVLDTMGVTASSNSTLALICGYLSDNPEDAAILWKEYNNTKKNMDCSDYSQEIFEKETFISSKESKEILTILKQNKNIILYGAPGVGKTWTAKRIAYLMMGKIDESRISTVQFHQSYSYENFIEGFKPDETSFHIDKGIFLKFCEKASTDPTNDYFFIIDEINRGNISKILGELLSLIENGYRGEDNAMLLTYSQIKFYVPENVYIIGMMNTADRSLAIIDYALRRRFAFIKVNPKFDTDGFRNLTHVKDNSKFGILVQAVVDLNKTIKDDPMLGEGFQIGHSYFCIDSDTATDELLTSIVKYQIAPMLNEYWFDNVSKAEEEINKLLVSIQ